MTKKKKADYIGSVRKVMDAIRRAKCVEATIGARRCSEGLDIAKWALTEPGIMEFKIGVIRDLQSGLMQLRNYYDDIIIHNK